MTISPDDIAAELAGLRPPALVGIGDSVLDCYLDEDLAYPGGNALNVAVYGSLLLGGTSHFIGITGDDRFGDHLRAVLDELGIDRSRTRTVQGPTGMAFVRLDDGDRRFVGSNRGGVQAELRLRCTDADLAVVHAADIAHTSAYAALVPELPRLAAQAEVSFDFSTERSTDLIDAVAPHASVGFFSGEGLDAEAAAELGRYAVSRGLEHAVVTRGSEGSVAVDRAGVTSAGIVHVDAVDSLGAGDGFITGFLAGRAAGAALDESLRIAALTGAYACTLRGAFGYPVVAGPDAHSQMRPLVGSA